METVSTKRISNDREIDNGGNKPSSSVTICLYIFENITYMLLDALLSFGALAAETK